MRNTPSEETISALRTALLSSAVLGVIGIVAALAYDRHWESAWQLIPWTIMAAVIVSLGLLTRPVRRVVWLVRLVALVTVASAVLVAWQHFDENHNRATGVARYSGLGEDMPTVKWWREATNDAAGGVPLVAAVGLVQLGLVLGASTIGLPAARRDEVDTGRGDRPAGGI